MKDEKKKKFYIASIESDDALAYAKENGVNPYPGTEYVPLSPDIDGAVARILDDVKIYQTKTKTIDEALKKLKSALIFEVEIPINKITRTMTSTDEDLKNYVFYGYRGQLPPEYITDVFAVDINEAQ